MHEPFGNTLAAITLQALQTRAGNLPGLLGWDGVTRTVTPMTDTADAERDEPDSDHLSSILEAVTGFRAQVDDLVETVHQHVKRLRADNGEQVIEHRTAAEFERVHEIGSELAQRLVDAQPIRSWSELWDIDGIGWTRANEVWNHFCA
jgi:hypothetical protein